MSEEQEQYQVPQPPKPKPANPFAIPVAIVIAGALIGAAVYFSGGNTTGTAIGTNTNNPTEQVTPETKVEPIKETDHIRGNPNAPIVLIEYSDYECPFCKNFHETMSRIMTEYGTDGKVAWVYRHLPLESLHPNAPAIAAGSECVAELGGNDAFWTFSDLIFSERATNELTDPTRVPEFAETAGVSRTAFEECLSSGRYTDTIVASIEEAIAANGGPQGLGTPFTLVFVGNEFITPISGAQPYNVIKENIDIILSNIEGGA